MGTAFHAKNGTRKKAGGSPGWGCRRKNSYWSDYERGRPDRQGRGEQLYDLSTDPGEQHNLAPQMPEKTSELRTLLQNITAGAVH